MSPGVTAEEVEVGVLYPDSGALAGSFVTARAGFDARLGLANADGGVHGRRIVYQWRDDQADPSINLSRSQELVEKEGVFAILEASTASSGGAAYLAEQGVPVMGLAVEDAWSQYRNMFSPGLSLAGGAPVDTFGKYLREQGGTRAMILWNPSAAASSTLILGQFTASVRAGGIELADSSIVEYKPGVTSPDRVVREMREAGIDTVVGLVDTDTLAAIIAAARQSGVQLKAIIGGSAPDSGLLDRYGPLLSGLTVYTIYIPFQTQSPALDTYRSAVARFAPQLDDPDQTVALASYVAADMLVRGLQEAGPCPTRQGFIDGLRAVGDYDADGLVATTDLDEDFGKLSECYAFVRVNAAGDALEVVNPNYCGTRLTG